MVKTATFNGVRYEIQVTDPIDGSCDYPRKILPVLHVAAPANTCKQLEIAIHESLHASDWTKSEERVTRTAHEIARLLWRLGYKRP